MSGALRLILNVLVLLGLCYLVNVRTVLHTLSQSRFAPMAAGFILLILACAVSAGVWCVLLQPLGYGLGFLNALNLSLIAFFMNNFLPAGIGGDAWRVWRFVHIAPRGPHREAPTLGGAAASVFAERGSAALAVIVMMWMVMPWCGRFLRGTRLPLPAGGGCSGTVALWTLTLLLTVAAAGVLALYSPLVHRLRGALLRRILSTGWELQTASFLEKLLVYRRFRAAFAGLTLFGVLSPLLESLAYWQLGVALGLTAGPLAYVALTPVLRLTHHVPFTVDGAGVQDAAMIWIMAAVGTDSAQALAFSLLIHAVKLCISLLGLGLYAITVLRWRS